MDTCTARQPRRGPRMLLAVLAALLTTTAPGLAAEKVIKLGVVGPKTGDFASGGISQLNGALLKAKEINAAKGDARVEIVSEDDASRCDQSGNITQKFINRERVLAILGAINSPCTLAMVPITAQAKVPQFTVSIGPAITQQGSKWIFRLALGAPAQTRELAQFAVKELKHTKHGVIFSNDEYGRGSAEGFKAALKDLGIEPLVYEAYARGDKDFTAQLTKLKNAGATAVFVTGSFVDDALIARQMKQMGLRLQILGDTGLATPKYYELAGDAADGTVIVEPFTPVSDDPVSQQFTRNFREQFKEDPTSWSAEFYDAVGIIAQAVGATGKVDRQALRDYVAEMKKGSGYKGVMGEIYFDERGDPLYSLYKVRIEGGKKKILAR